MRASTSQDRNQSRLLHLDMVILCMIAFTLAQSVDDVVAKAIKARGGIERIKHLQTQRLTGKFSLNNEEGPLVVEFKRPGMMREMVTLGGKAQIRTTDGRVGWRDASPPQQLGAEELRNLAGSADFEGPLVDYQQKGAKIELAGKEQVKNRLAYKLVITMKDGENRTDFIDCKSFLEVKWQGKGFESYFRDYRRVDGLMYAFEIDSGQMGQPANQKIVFEKVELNPPLDDSRFGKP